MKYQNFSFFTKGNYCQIRGPDPHRYIRQIKNRGISSFYWNKKEVCDFSLSRPFQKVSKAAAQNQGQRNGVFSAFLPPQAAEKQPAVPGQKATGKKEDLFSFPAAFIISNAFIFYVPKIKPIFDNFFFTVHGQFCLYPFFCCKIHPQNHE